ncbi:MAG: TolC family protein [bacterium]
MCLDNQPTNLQMHQDISLIDWCFSILVFWCSIIVAILISNHCFSYDLTLNQALEIATSQNLSLKKAGLVTILSEAELKANYALKYPRLGFNLNSGYNEIKEPSFGQRTIGKPDSPWTNQISLTLSQYLYTGGKISNGITLFQSKRDISRYQEKIVREELFFNIALAYWELKKTILAEGLAEKKKEHLELLLKEAKERYSAGLIPKIEVQRQHTLLSQANYELKKAQIIQGKANNNLCLLLNLSQKEMINPIDEPKVEEEVRTLPYLINEALSKRAEIKQAKNGVEEKESFLGVKTSEKRPQVSLLAQLNWGAWEDEWRKSISSLKSSDWKVMLNLDFLLFDSGKINAEIEEAKTQLNIAKIEEEEIEKKIISEVYQAYQDVLDAKEGINTYQERVSLEEENLQQAYLQRDLGKITPAQLSKIELSYEEARIDLFDAKINYIIQKATLAKSVGEVNNTSSTECWQNWGY